MAYHKTISLDDKSRVLSEKDKLFSLSKFVQFCLNDKAIMNKYKKYAR